MIYLILIAVSFQLAIGQQISSNDVVGDMPYEFKIDNGDSVLKIAIPMPKGISGFLPIKINLEYRSSLSGLNQEVGLSWLLTGLSSIVRCSKNPIQEGLFEKVSFTLDDKYCIDGQKLIVTTGVYGQDKSEYVTEINEFNKIVSYGSIDSKGPKFFKVFTKSNRILTYGFDDSSSSAYVRSVLKKWPLTKVEDYLGNKISYKYIIEPDYIYFDSVIYANKKISIEYESRDDAVRNYFDSAVYDGINKRIKSIRISSSNDNGQSFITTKSIELTYVKYGVGQASLLTSVRMCFVKTYNCLRPLNFNYDKQTTKTTQRYDSLGPYFCGNAIGGVCQQTQVVDMNGDGILDVAAFGPDGVYITENTYYGWFYSQTANYQYVQSNVLTTKLWSREFGSNSGWDDKKHLKYLIDVNGDRLADVVGFWTDGVYVSINLNGKTFSSKTKWSNYFGSNEAYDQNKDSRVLIDVNNDGLPDIICFSKVGLRISFNNNGQKFDEPVLISSQISSQTSTNFIYLPTFSDINADGLTDFVLLMNKIPLASDSNINYKISFDQISLKKSNFEDISVHVDLLGASWDMIKNQRLFADVNNDNLPDLIGFKSNKVIVSYGQLNDLNGRTEYLNIQTFVLDSSQNLDDNYKLVYDVNSDGLADIVIFKCDGVYVSYGDGKVFNYPQMWLDSLKSCSPRSSGYTRSIMDVDGDGILDAVAVDYDIVKIAYGTWSDRVRLTLLTDSLDNGVRISYSSLIKNNNLQTLDDTEKFSQSSSAFWLDDKYSMFGVNRQIVDKFERSMSMKYNSFDRDVLTTYYKYGDYKCSTIVGRYSCKFAWIEITENNSPLRRRSEFNQIYPYSNQAKSESTYYQTTLIENVQYTYDVKVDVVSSMISYRINLVSSNTKHFNEITGNFVYSHNVDYAYDNYSNLIMISDYTSDDINKVYYLNKQIFDVVNDKTSWYLNKIEKIEQTYTLNNDPQTMLRKVTQFSYDDVKRVQMSKVYLPTDDYLGLKESYQYDKFGNVIKLSKIPINQSIPGNKIRIQQYIYDNYGVNKVKYLNSLNHPETYEYDSDDNLAKKTNANNHVTIYNYDELGRLVEEKSMDKFNISSTTYKYEWYSSQRQYNQTQSRSVISVFKMTKTNTDGRVEARLLDSSKRVIRLITYDLVGNEIYEDLTYFIPGLNQYEMNSLKYKANGQKPVYVTIKYDDLSREIERTEPAYDPYYLTSTNLQGQYYGYYRIVTSYDGFKKTIDKRNETRNVLGNIVQVEEPLASTAKYEYDALNNLVKVTDQTNTITLLKYDLNNNRIYFDENNLGKYKYEYNAYNELMSELNLDTNSKIVYERDLLGRVVGRVEKERVTKLEFDNSPNGIGQVSRLFISYSSSSLVNYTVDYEYDELSRVVNKLVTYNSNLETNIEKLGTTYDRSNRISRLDYPDNFSIYYCYGDYGHLRSVSVDGADCQSGSFIWKAIDYNADQNILRETFGNGIWQQYDYDSTSVLRRIQAARNLNNNSLDFLRKLEYNYDYKRNLIERKYYLNSVDKLSLSDQFSYDDLDRLTRSNSYTYKTNTMRTKSKSISFNYDSIGNILQTSDGSNVNNYAYNTQGINNKPQQIANINGETILYDQNGNVVQTASYQIDWFTYQKAKRIKTNTTSIEFNYGNENQRIVRIAKPLDNQAVTSFELNYYLDEVHERLVYYDTQTNKPYQQIDKYNIKVFNKIVATHTRVKNLNNDVKQDSKLSKLSVSQTASMTYYMHNDVTCSPDTITDQNGYVLARYKYEAFGQRVILFSNLSSLDSMNIINRGFTGHEYIDQGRLINMNGRIFDSVHFRFLSPDYIQNYYKTQNLNRYSYCLNNPFKYNDPTGYSLWKAFVGIAIAVVTGGVMASLAGMFMGAVGIAQGTLLASFTTGVFVGAGSSFASTLFMTGNFDVASRNALLGGLTGGLGYGAENFLHAENTGIFDPKRLAFQTVSNGVSNRISRRKFFDGIDSVFASFALELEFSRMTNGEKAGYQTGDDFVTKDTQTMPKMKDMNVGNQGEDSQPFLKVNPKKYADDFWCGHEGCGLMRTLNEIPGMNAISVYHDALGIKYTGPMGLRTTTFGNYGTMLPSAAIALGAIYNQVKCVDCFK